jgi:hypothetical protein
MLNLHNIYRKIITPEVPKTLKYFKNEKLGGI